MVTDTRPDGPNWFKSADTAIAEADRRAAITQYRYRVRYDARNRWWNITETHNPVRSVTEAWGAVRRVEALLIRWRIQANGKRGLHDNQLEEALYGQVKGATV